MDVIVSHVNADFDSLGGLLGASLLYPGAALVLPSGAAPNVRDFLSLHRDLILLRPIEAVEPETITRVIVVDTPSRRRIGQAAKWLDLPDVEVHLYDHHVATPPDFNAAVSHFEPLGSVSTIVATLARERDLMPSAIEATAMLLGIYEDTGSLTFSATRAEDLEAAAWLVRQGGDLEAVAEFLQRGLTEPQRRLLEQFHAHLQRHEIRGVAVAVAIAPPGPYVEEASDLAHRILEAEDVEAVFLLAEMADSLYVIGRARSEQVDVGAALKALGGGGHRRAASAMLPVGQAEATASRLLHSLEEHLAPEPTAVDLMSRPVRAIPPETTVLEAGHRMVKYGHSGLAVMEQGRLLGIVTRRDLDKARHHRLEHSPVRSFMTAAVHTVTPTTPLSELERVMIGENIGRLPVLDAGEVIGIVTRTDVLRALYGSRYLAGSAPAAEPSFGDLMTERLPAPVQRLLRSVGEAAAECESEVYVVGGFVRDVLLDVDNLDLDFLVEPDAERLARNVAERLKGDFKREQRFDAAKVYLPDGQRLDFSTARTESYAHPGALPVVEASSIVDDLRRRDFTLNAMAASLRPEHFGKLLDPFGGQRDLERKVLRVLHPLSFVEDPTRIFRAVRFEERYRFRIDADTEALAREAVEKGALASISPERLLREFRRLFGEPRGVGAVLRLEDLGVLRWLHPALELDRRLLQLMPAAIQWWRTLGEHASTDVAMLAGMLHPLTPAAAVEVAEQRLKVPAPEWALLQQSLRAGERMAELLGEGANAELYRRLHSLPGEAMCMLRARTLQLGKDAQPQRERLERYASALRPIRLEIGGSDLKEAGIEAGPAMGRALQAALDAKLNGLIHRRDEELKYAVEWLQSAVSPKDT